MDIFLHIGHEKTGTSSIQRCLFDNQQELAAAGFLYCEPKPHSHFHFVTLLGLKTRSTHPQNKKNAEEALRRTKEHVAKGKYHTLIISAENFWTLPSASIDRFMGLLGIPFKNRYACAYIRRPDNFYLSFLQQEVKGDSRIPMPWGFDRAYSRHLQTWMTVTGKDNMLVRPYDKSVLFKHDVVSDFLKVLAATSGHTVPAIRQTDYNLNVSLFAEEIILLRAYRERVLKEHDGIFHPKSAALIDFFQNANSVIGNSLTVPKLKEEHAKAVLALNYSNIAEVDTIFGTNLIDLFYGSTRPKPFQQNKPTDIGQILDHWEASFLEELALLIPEFQKTTPEQSLNHSNLLYKVLPFDWAYANYLSQLQEWGTLKVLLRNMVRNIEGYTTEQQLVLTVVERYSNMLDKIG